jgi:hypothetical protein
MVRTLHKRAEVAKKRQAAGQAASAPGGTGISIRDLAKPDMFGMYGLAQLTEDKKALGPVKCIADKLVRRRVPCCRY